MKAMILAAGVGSRLSPLTLFLPKPMVPIVNKPVMEHIIELLAYHNIKEIIVNLHNQPHLIESYFGDGRRWGVHITYSLERELLGTAGAVRRMASHFDDTFVVMMGDAITDLDLEAMVAFHRERKAQATIALHPVDDPTLFGVVQVHASGRILRFQEKPTREEALSNLANMGVYIFEPSILDLIPPRTMYDFGHHLFPLLLEKGVPFYGYQADCYWSDIGTFSEYRRTQGAILRGEALLIRIPGRQVSEGVWQGRNVTVHPRARLVPPLVIGDNCQIRADAIIGPETVLGHHVIVDEGATVVGSTVLDGTYVGRLVNVQEAVVNRNCLISVPAATSVFVADRFLLGEVAEEALARGVRRALEWVGALVLFLASFPLWPLAALLAWLNGRGPLLVQEPRATADPEALRLTGRVGWRTVYLPRFRDEPVTWAGRLLRRLGLAGLPGLLSVLRGELALVGVGPLTPDQAETLTEDWQRQRFLHPAGLTGLWYVSSNEDTTLEAQLIVDSYYAVTRTWRDDLRILWQTPGAWWRRLRQE
jgi:mannose-1-phosphate guanylyltransferase